MSDTTAGDGGKGERPKVRRSRPEGPGRSGADTAAGAGKGGSGVAKPERARTPPKGASARPGKIADRDKDRAGKPGSDRPRFDKTGDRPRAASNRIDKAGAAAGPREDDRSSAPGGERQHKPFRPKSRGMLSHGGGDGGKPKSYGRLSHERGDVERGKRPADGGTGGGRPGPRIDPRPETTEPAGHMRIAKRLARAGIASRRDAEGMIADGRIKVNGKLLDTPAMTVSAGDHIEVDGTPLAPIERTRLWLFHKPAGLVTTNRDPEGRPTVFDRLPQDMPRVLSVGRLDIATEGLLLLTNDGGLSRMLELPATGWLRRYRVRAHGAITQARLDELRQGVAIDGVFYGAVEAALDREQGSNVWLTLGLREGKNREVKRILAHLGLEVNRLIRVSFGPFQLGDLAEGAVREIRGRTLREQLGERLIEESGADFDAAVTKPFSNRPVEAERTNDVDKPKKRGDWISASETAPNKKKVRAARREEALDRLDTRPGGPAARGGPRERTGEGRERPGPRQDKRFDKPRQEGAKPRGPGGGKPHGDREQPARKPLGGGKRAANVWMAPGARPRSEKAFEPAEAPRDATAGRGRTRSDPRRSPGRGGKSGGPPPRRGDKG